MTLPRSGRTLVARRTSTLPAIGIAAAIFAQASLAAAQDPPKEPPTPADEQRPAASPPPKATEIAKPGENTPRSTEEANARLASSKPAAQDPPKSEENEKPAAANGANQDLTKLQRGDSPPGTVPGLSFKDLPVADFVSYIQEWTGKAVLLKSGSITTQKITLVDTRELTKHQALDLIFTAFRLNDVAVVELPSIIILVGKDQLPNIPLRLVLPPERDPLTMTEEGVFVTKVFRLKNTKAGDIYERLSEVVTAETGGTLTADTNSNQLILEGDIGLAKRVQLLINNLDVPVYLPVRTETFFIKYQDAQLMADNIRDLFEGYGVTSGGQPRTPRATGGAAGRNRQQQPGGQPQAAPQVGTSEALVVTVVPALNAITVRAEPQIVEEIRKLLERSWDQPPDKNGSPFRTYELTYADPIKVRDTLVALLETGSGVTRSGSRGAGAGGRSPISGGGGSTGADVAVSNVFRFEAYTDAKRLVVISKTPDNFAWLDSIIKQLDVELDVGLPKNVPLKYASAFDLSDILNILLAGSGSSGGQLERPSETLSGFGDLSLGGGASGTSGASGDGGARDGGTTDGTGGGGASYPWQSGSRGAGGVNAEQSEPSAIIDKARIVPNATQNSLLVLAPPQIEAAVLQMIEELDRPGRQVMITAVLAEVSLGDGESVGIRVGSGTLVPLNGPDYAVGGTVGLDLSKGNGEAGGENFASPWFDLSVLNVNTEVSFLLQALAATNNVRILQEPRVFTSDNEEAVFQAGQDVSLQTGTTVGAGTGGTTTNTFEPTFVGVGLNVRPRITRDKNVYMDINILLSNLNPALQFNSNPVIDRRQVNTRVTVKNGQTIVLSGIRRERETNIKRAIPVIGTIPILDLFFSSTEKQKEIAELVVFITPVVVENPEENDTNFNVEERGRLEKVTLPLDQVERSGGGRFFYERLHSLEEPSRPAAAPRPAPPVEPEPPQNPPPTND